MRDQLQKEIDANIELIAGSNGIFVVAVNGVEIISKKTAGHIPQLAEIVPLLKKH